MIGAIRRKLGQLAADPTLRRYLAERLLGRIASPPGFMAGHPPYLDSLDLGPSLALPSFPRCDVPAPAAPLRLDLPGESLTLRPHEAGELFERPFADLETRLAVHRFAWLPVAGEGADPAWVAALWREWVLRHGTPTDGWEWHPYTAAERAINLLDFSRRHGFPGDDIGILATHAPAIAARLEYYGEHHTGNHLANNGRGLYRLGLALGWERAAAMGLAILLAEAERIFAPSGMLREGSSHYHLLVCRNYLSVWLEARRAGRPETARLEEICRAALAVMPHLALPGGLPLVGDISPDCPPAFLAGLLPGGSGGWIDGLDGDDWAALAVLAEWAGTADSAALARDGWRRADHGPWALLVHAAPQGWPLMPGHGHQDLGGFELHWRGLKLIVDPGRGAYGEAGEAALYRSAAVHNLLRLDGADPTGPNRPYYDDAFRRREGGEVPVLSGTEDGIGLVHHGFRRQGATLCRRDWRFAGDALVIEDHVEGRGTRLAERGLCLPWPVTVTGNKAVIETPAGRIAITADVPLVARAITAWTGYGVGTPATRLVAEARVTLPFTGRLMVEAL